MKAIRTFLRHARFYRSWNFSKVVEPLTDLLVKDATFNFCNECLKAFNVLKEKLISSPIVIALDYFLLFELMYDASDTSVKVTLR